LILTFLYGVLTLINYRGVKASTQVSNVFTVAKLVPLFLVAIAGTFYLLFTISSVIGGDVGAYFVGRKYGRRKLAPAVSPGKTVEGAVGAIGAGLLVGLIWKAGFDALRPELSAQLGWLACAMFAPVLAGVGIIGDLVESLLKRDAQVKDTGTLLPGMGGVLDRIDSNLLAIPVMYYLLLAHTFLFGRVPLAAVGAGPF
jgi:phosphatidate cytidylyltransferase